MLPDDRLTKNFDNDLTHSSMLKKVTSRLSSQYFKNRLKLNCFLALKKGLFLIKLLFFLHYVTT